MGGNNLMLSRATFHVSFIFLVSSSVKYFSPTFLFFIISTCSANNHPIINKLIKITFNSFFFSLILIRSFIPMARQLSLYLVLTQLQSKFFFYLILIQPRSLKIPLHILARNFVTKGSVRIQTIRIRTRPSMFNRY